MSPPNALARSERRLLTLLEYPVLVLSICLARVVQSVTLYRGLSQDVWLALRQLQKTNSE
jgi:hypothetical protein